VRHEFSDDEKKHKWLPTLLDAYAIADEVNTELLKERAQQGIRIACSKGCPSCCKRPSVPFTAPELMGISWFAAEKLAAPARALVKQQLRRHETTSLCPFLVNSDCSIYPVRPLACRQFFVAGAPCKDNEKVMESRPQDLVFTPREGAHQVAMKLLEHFGIKRHDEKVKAFNSGFIVANSKHLYAHDWNHIADSMDAADQKT
jgi:Fe-S-cluster containining protein